MLKLEEVTADLGGKRIIDGFSAEFAPGVYAIMAPSGRGKTTLLRAIAGLIPFGGSITGAGKTAMLFQDDRLFPWLTVLQNAAITDKTEAAAAKWLACLGLSGYENAMPDTLSGGMQRRVSIAAWLVYGGDTLLMDEPTRGLDEDNAGRVMDIACRYAAGKPLIFTTHSPFLAQRFADRIITL